jgi:polyisoprenyl-phosphate glycosyltransferase
MKKISVIVPVYFNEGSLAPLLVELQKVEKQLQAEGMELELIFVDDGSGDNSFVELLKIREQRPATRIVKLARNFGSYHAIKTGLRLVTGDCFTYLAADLQDPPDLILEMAQRWREGSKYVVCARSQRKDPPLTKLFASWYYKLLRLFVVKDYPTGGYDLALMDRAFLFYLLESGKNINLALFAYWLGFKPSVIQYERRERVHGKSRWTFAKKLKLFLDSLLGFSIVPIRMISVIGIIVSLMSFGYGAFIIINAVMGNIPIQGFAAIVALVSFLLGLIIIMLGVIGEYLWRVYDEVNKRPESVIEEIL